MTLNFNRIKVFLQERLNENMRQIEQKEEEILDIMKNIFACQEAQDILLTRKDIEESKVHPDHVKIININTDILFMQTQEATLSEKVNAAKESIKQLRQRNR